MIKDQAEVFRKLELQNLIKASLRKQKNQQMKSWEAAEVRESLPEAKSNIYIYFLYIFFYHKSKF